MKTLTKSNLTLRLEDEERAWLEDEARKQSRSMGNFIRYVLHDYKVNHCASSSEADMR